MKKTIVRTAVIALLALCWLETAVAGGVGESAWNQNQLNGNPNKSCPTKGTANPINIIGQNKFHEELIFQGAGQFPLEYKLYYNSRRYGSITYDSSGNGIVITTPYFVITPSLTTIEAIYGSWSFSYSQHLLFVNSSKIHVVREDGQAIIFSKDTSGNYVVDSPSNKEQAGKLIKDAGGYKYYTLDGKVETFDLTTGRLAAVESVSGKGKHTLTYATTASMSTSKMIEVKNNQRDERLLIVYTINSSKIPSYIYYPDNTLVSFDVEKTTGETVDIVRGINWPSGEKTKFDYGYSNTYQKGNSWLEQSALTGIRTLDATGKQEFESWYLYDDKGYATKSIHGATAVAPAIADSVKVDGYPAHKITVTNLQGRQTIYSVDGTVARFKSVEGQEAGACGVSNSEITYDSDGNIDTVKQTGDARLSPNDTLTTVDYDYYQSTDQNYAGLPKRVTIKGVENGLDRVIDYDWSGVDSGAAARQLRSIKYYDPGSTTQVRRQVNIDYQLGYLAKETEQDNSVDPTGYARAHSRTKTTSYQVDAWYDQSLGKIKTLSVIGPRNDATVHEFATNGNLLSIKNALNQIYTFSGHNVFGYPTKMLDPNNITTDLGYDPRGRLTKIEINGSNTSFEYTVRNDLKKVTFGDSSFLKFDYDDGGTLIRVSNQTGEKIEFSRSWSNTKYYETLIRKTFTASNASRMNSEIQFDALGRIWKVFDQFGANGTSGGTFATFKHDSRGNPISTNDGFSGEVTRVFDALGRLKEYTDRRDTSVPAKLDYDVLDNVTKVTDQNNNQTTYHYDGFGNLLQVVSPDTGTTSYYYDNAANVTKVVDANNVTTKYSYDLLDRLTGVDYSTQADVTYEYDKTTINGESSYGIGRLTGVSVTGGGRIDWIYDARGNVIKDIRTIGGNTYSTVYQYDLADRITSIQYPTGRIVSYVRTNGKVTSVTLQEHAQASARTVASGIEFEPFGPLKSLTHGNTLTTNINYDVLYRVDALASGKATNLDYLYDTRSNLDSVTDLRTSTATPNRSQDLEYDGAERLKMASGDYGRYDYVYDGGGNLNKKAWSKSGQSYNEILTIGPGNRLSGKSRTGLDQGSETYTYSSTGNTTSISKLYPQSFGYNDAGRMVSASYNGAQVGTYGYNGMGERDSKTANGQIRNFIYDLAGKLLHEATSDNSWRRDYIYIGDRLIAIADNSSPYGSFPNTWYGSYIGSESAPNIDISSGALTVNVANLQYGQSYLAARQLVGNGELSAKVPTLTGTGRGAEAGLEIRESALDSANYVRIARYAKRKIVFIGSAPTIPILLPTTNETIRLTVRDNAGDRVTDVAVGNYQYLRISRNLNTVTAYASVDGNSWTQIGTSTTLNLANSTAVIGFRTAGTSSNAVVQYGSVAASGTAQINNGLYFVHTDHLGTPQEITDKDRTTLWEAMFNPYGEGLVKTALLENNVRMPGQYYDAESGLHYNYFRDYDPKTGRYIQSDPIGQAGGLNTYSYAFGKPETYTDPTGEIVPAAVGGYLRCLAQCSATSAASDAIAGQCVNLSGSAQSCAMDCVNPLNWFKIGKVGVVAKGAPPIKWGAQEKHFPGHNSYTPGRSTMTSDPTKLAEKAGTGQQVGKVPVGQPGSKERVNFGEKIGDYIDQAGNASPTTNGIIHYSNDGIHIVPARP